MLLKSKAGNIISGIILPLLKESWAWFTRKVWVLNHHLWHLKLMSGWYVCFQMEHSFGTNGPVSRVWQVFSQDFVCTSSVRQFLTFSLVSNLTFNESRQVAIRIYKTIRARISFQRFKINKVFGQNELRSNKITHHFMDFFYEHLSYIAYLPKVVDKQLISFFKFIYERNHSY